jgi:hypothetical protein
VTKHPENTEIVFGDCANMRARVAWVFRTPKADSDGRAPVDRIGFVFIARLLTATDGANMKILSFCVCSILALSVPISVAAQSTQAYKLLVRWEGGGIAITDYPSRMRCEAGRIALLREIARQFPDRPPQSVPGGGTIFSMPVAVDAICFAG